MSFLLSKLHEMDYKALVSVNGGCSGYLIPWKNYSYPRPEPCNTEKSGSYHCSGTLYSGSNTVWAGNEGGFGIEEKSEATINLFLCGEKKTAMDTTKINNSFLVDAK